MWNGVRLWTALLMAALVGVACTASPGPWRGRTGGSLTMTWSLGDAPTGSLLVIAQEPIDFAPEVEEFSVEKVEPHIGAGLTLEDAGVLNMKGYSLGGFDEIYSASGQLLHEREDPLPELESMIPLGTVVSAQTDDRFVLVLLVRVEGGGVDASIDTYDVVYTVDGHRHRAHVPTHIHVRDESSALDGARQVPTSRDSRVGSLEELPRP